MEKRNPDEIDLYALLVKTVFFFRANKWVFVIFCVLGLAASATDLKFPRTVYISKMTVLSDVIRLPVCAQILTRINNAIADQETDSLIKFLHVTPAQALLIAGVGAEALTLQKKISFDSIYNIRVVVTDRSVLPSVQKGIIGFLSENEFVKVRLAYQQERAATEALKNYYPFTKAIEVISGFSSYKKEAESGNIILMMEGFLAGIGAGLLFIGIRQVIKIARS